MDYLPVGALYFGQDGLCSAYPRGYGLDKFMILPTGLRSLKANEKKIKEAVDLEAAEAAAKLLITEIAKNEKRLAAQLIFDVFARIDPSIIPEGGLAHIRATDTTEADVFMDYILASVAPSLFEKYGINAKVAEYRKETLQHFLGLTTFSDAEKAKANAVITPALSDLDAFPASYARWCKDCAAFDPASLADYVFKTTAENLYQGNLEKAARRPLELIKNVEKQDQLILPWLIDGADKLPAVGIFSDGDTTPYLIGATVRLYSYTQLSSTLIGDKTPLSLHGLDGFCSAIDPSIYLSANHKLERSTVIEEKVHLLDFHLPLPEKMRSEQTRLFQEFPQKIDENPTIAYLAGMEMMQLTPNLKDPKYMLMASVYHIYNNVVMNRFSDAAAEREGLPHMIALQDAFQKLSPALKKELEGKSWVKVALDISQAITEDFKSAVIQTLPDTAPLNQHRLDAIQALSGRSK